MATVSKTTEKLNITLKPSNFDDFVSKLDDLTKISDVIKLKIDSENILMYSMMGSDNMILAFKSYMIETSEYFEMKGDIDYTLNIIITSAKKFVKNLAFVKKTDKILMEVHHKATEDDISDARLVLIKNAKFKLQVQTGENTEIRDLSKSALSKRMDLKNCKWNFKINNSDFSDVKKLASINSDDTRRILHLNVHDGKVLLSEVSLWELEVDDVSATNKHLMFNKSFLNSINDNGNDIEFNVFETFILIKDEISNLMISFEQDLTVD